MWSKIKLETTSLELIKEDETTYRIITPNYRNNKCQLFKLEDNFKYVQYVDTFNDSYFKELDKDHKDDVLKLLVVDLTMEQEDRYARNMGSILSRYHYISTNNSFFQFIY